MAHIVADVNELCLTDWHYRLADKITQCGRGFWHFLSLDGAKIAAATLYGIDWTSAQPVSVSSTEKHFSLSKTSEIKKQREAGCRIAESMMTVLMIERHMLQMRLYNMLCNLLYTYLDILYNTEGVI